MSHEIFLKSELKQLKSLKLLYFELLQLLPREALTPRNPLILGTGRQILRRLPQMIKPEAKLCSCTTKVCWNRSSVQEKKISDILISEHEIIFLKVAVLFDYLMLNVILSIGNV